MMDDHDSRWTNRQLESVLNRVVSEIPRRSDEQIARWESIDVRLARQADLIQSSTREVEDLIRFAENTEAWWIDLDKRIRAIEDRLKGAA